MVHEVVRHHMILHNNTYARMVIVRMVTARTTHSGAAAAATLLCPGGGERERERAQRAGAYHVVQYRSQQNPKGGHSIKTWCGWAGRWPEGHDVTPKPSRKKKRENKNPQAWGKKERARTDLHKQTSTNPQVVKEQAGSTHGAGRLKVSTHQALTGCLDRYFGE